MFACPKKEPCLTNTPDHVSVLHSPEAMLVTGLLQNCLKFALKILWLNPKSHTYLGPTI